MKPVSDIRAVDLCPPPHLTAADLDGDTVVTISGVEIKEVGEEKARRGVVFFSEFDRGMVFNKTNSRRVADLIGTERVAEWIGKQITLYPSETDFAGRTVPCIRVREKK